VVGLDNLKDNIQRSYHNISFDYIPLWNDWPVGYSGYGSSHVFLCPLSDSTLRATGRHDSAKNNHKYLPKITSRILEKNSAL
jgi:hypothetical protein